MNLIKKKFFILLLLLICIISNLTGRSINLRGWNILSDDETKAKMAIDQAQRFDINHLQLSHNLIMDLREMRDTNKRERVNRLTHYAHDKGIKEVVVWDHALYKMDYYPEEYKTGSNHTLNLDDPRFWNFFKSDYREMLALIPDVDGLVLTFIETGARAERQYSKRLSTGTQKLAAVVDAIADVVCVEFRKKLYIRTFGYTEAEYSNTIGALNHIKSKDIVVMMKETPHDFFLTHPNNKFIAQIERPVIVEFDTGNEFNGQGVVANTWAGHIVRRWSSYYTMQNVVGYVARTDRYGNTSIINTPNEVLLYALKEYTNNPSVSKEQITSQFISDRYKDQAHGLIAKAFDLAYDINTSIFYTLGTNTSCHSSLNYDPYNSSYARHVSGKWISPAIVDVKHGVNRTLHYWKNVIEHIAPARFKNSEGNIRREAPFVIDSMWVSPKEMINQDYLNYIITEKDYGVKLAKEALYMIYKARPYLQNDKYDELSQLFERTLLCAKLHRAVAGAYWGYRLYARGNEYQTKAVIKSVSESLRLLDIASDEIDNYPFSVPKGEWDWREDASRARRYKTLIINGWPEYNNIKFKY